MQGSNRSANADPPDALRKSYLSIEGEEDPPVDELEVGGLRQGVLYRRLQ